jgi:hypothetical protein
MRHDTQSQTELEQVRNVQPSMSITENAFVVLFQPCQLRFRSMALCFYDLFLRGMVVYIKLHFTRYDVSKAHLFGRGLTPTSQQIR